MTGFGMVDSELLPFDVELAKQGRVVCFDDGVEVDYVAHDKSGTVICRLRDEFDTLIFPCVEHLRIKNRIKQSVSITAYFSFSYC